METITMNKKLSLTQVSKSELIAKLLLINLEYNRKKPKFSNGLKSVEKMNFLNFCKNCIETHFEGTENQKEAAKWHLALHLLGETNLFDNLLNS
jgi:hypothetical protein